MARLPNSIPMPDFTRPMLEAEIERLIDLLDAMDPDPDLEPSLGWAVPALGPPEHVCGGGMSIAMTRLLNPYVEHHHWIEIAPDRRDLHLDQGLGDELEHEDDDEGFQEGI